MWGEKWKYSCKNLERHIEMLTQLDLKRDWIPLCYTVPFSTSSHSLSFPNLTTKLINTSLRSTCPPDAARCSDKVSHPSTQLNFCLWLMFAPFSHTHSWKPCCWGQVGVFFPRAGGRRCQLTHVAAQPLLRLSQFCCSPSPPAQPQHHSKGLLPKWPSQANSTLKTSEVFLCWPGGSHNEITLCPGHPPA